MGLLAALVQMSNTRLAMAIIPPMGRNHFFAIYSVAGNVTLGLAPIGWGLLIDAIGVRSILKFGMSWNQFTVFFAAAAAVFVLTLALVFLLVGGGVAVLYGVFGSTGYTTSATETQTFWKVTFPLVLPAIVGAALLSFSLSFDDYIITNFTSGDVSTK